MTIHILIPIANGLMVASDGAGVIVGQFEGPFERRVKVRPALPNKALLALGSYFQTGPNGTFDLLNDFGAMLDTAGIEAAVDHLQGLIQFHQLPRTFNDNINSVIILSAEGFQTVAFDYAAPTSTTVLRPQVPEPTPLERSLLIGPRNLTTPRWSELVPPEHLAYFTAEATPIAERTKDSALNVIRSLLPAARQISYLELSEIPISSIFDAFHLSATGVESLVVAEPF